MFAKLELGIIFETLEEASVYASRFFQVKRIFGFVEEEEHFKFTELKQRKNLARQSAREAWGRWFPGLSASDIYLSDAIVEIRQVRIRFFFAV